MSNSTCTVLSSPHYQRSYTKIDQNSRQNFILRGRFPRESCRSRRDLQLSLGNLPPVLQFCLEFWSNFVECPVPSRAPNLLHPLASFRDLHLAGRLEGVAEAPLLGVGQLSSDSFPSLEGLYRQNSRQNFILGSRFPRESCRSRRDLQLSLGNLWMRMKFCLEFWLIFGFDMDLASSIYGTLINTP